MEGEVTSISDRCSEDCVQTFRSCVDGYSDFVSAINRRHNVEETTTFGGGQQSYVAMIAKAILSSSDNRLQLADIYDFIGAAFFPRHPSPENGKTWRNNIRHHLSVNDCFVKVGGGRRGRGSFWAVHPACLEAFSRGDYRQRRWTSRRSVRRHRNISESEERYVTMQRIISPSDELYVHLLSSGVFAKLNYACSGSLALS